MCTMYENFPTECVLTSFPVLIAKDRGSLVQLYDIRGRHELDLSYYVAMCVGNLGCNTTQRMKLSVQHQVYTTLGWYIKYLCFLCCLSSRLRHCDVSHYDKIYQRAPAVQWQEPGSEAIRMDGILLISLNCTFHCSRNFTYVFSSMNYFTSFFQLSPAVVILYQYSRKTISIRVSLFFVVLFTPCFCNEQELTCFKQICFTLDAIHLQLVCCGVQW